MANLDTLPTANTDTPKSSRAGSRARKQAGSTVSADTNAERMPPAITEQTGTDQPAGDTETTAEDQGRMPPERAPSDNTTETVAEAAAPPPPVKLMVLSAKNPKRIGTFAHGFFQKYFGSGETPHISTLDEVYGRGVRGKDVSWDRDRGHILLGDDVDAYLACSDDAARIEFLKGKFGDRAAYAIKQAGIVIEPPVAEVAAAADQAAPSTEGSAPSTEQTPVAETEQVEGEKELETA